MPHVKHGAAFSAHRAPKGLKGAMPTETASGHPRGRWLALSLDDLRPDRTEQPCRRF